MSLEDLTLRSKLDAIAEAMQNIRGDGFTASKGASDGSGKTPGCSVVHRTELLLGEFGHNDKVAVWEHADTAKQLADFTTPHDRLDQFFLNSEVPDSSETNLYDALVNISTTMKDVTGRKAMIVITSGVDTFSNAIYEDALNAVRDSGTPI